MQQTELFPFKSCLLTRNLSFKDVNVEHSGSKRGNGMRGQTWGEAGPSFRPLQTGYMIHYVCQTAFTAFRDTRIWKELLGIIKASRQSHQTMAGTFRGQTSVGDENSLIHCFHVITVLIRSLLILVIERFALPAVSQPSGFLEHLTYIHESNVKT